MAYEFKIKLEGSSKPPIWRKVKVNENISFLDFHMVIQGVFGWANSHLFQFSPKGWGSRPRLQQDFGDNDWDEDGFSEPKTWPFGERYNASKIKLEDYFHSPKQKMAYTYDFGDDWRHTVELVDITDEKPLHPVCLAGKAQAPVDDCGGIWGYYNMVEAINDPEHPEHEDFMEWMDFTKGQKWDENEFDLAETNKMLIRVWDVWGKEKNDG